MDQRSRYLIQIIEKIGSPLLTAVTARRAMMPPTEGQEEQSFLSEESQTVAGLLAKTVQASVDLAQTIDLNTTEDQGDALRVALSAVASPLVARQYGQTGQVPSDQDLKKLGTGLQAILTFSENFSAEEANITRLEHMRPEGQAADPHQVQIQYIYALIPILNAIGAFAFGQAEQKLVRDVAEKLVQKAESLGKQLAPEAKAKAVELGILGALAAIYAACHTAETARLMGLDEQARAKESTTDESGTNPALKRVWEVFDVKTAMLEALVGNILPVEGGSTKAPTPAQTPAQETPVSPVAPPPATPPAETKSEAAATPAGHNPMAMFAKKDSDATPAAEAQAPPPPPLAPEDTPAVEPPATPPPAGDTPKEEDKPADTSPPAGGNPMSFFSKKDGDA